MLKRTLILFFTSVVLLTFVSTGEAFVPQTPHLLHLMVRKIKSPAGLVVHQNRRVPEGRDKAEPLNVDEKLRYYFPGMLRSDVRTGPSQSFYLSSGGNFVRVTDGVISARQPSFADLYTDILLYRDYESLGNRLAQYGINVDKVTFQRFEGRICYFIGQPPVNGQVHQGLWIDRDSLFPVRYLIRRGKWLVDVRYEDWGQVSKTWYPMKTRVFVDDQLFVEVMVSRIELKSDFLSSDFDLDRIIRQYPVQNASDRTGDRDLDLDKELDEFNKLYD